MAGAGRVSPCPSGATFFPVLPAAKAAAAIVSAIERGPRTIVAPGIYRLVFLLDSLFPGRTEALLSSQRR